MKVLVGFYKFYDIYNNIILKFLKMKRKKKYFKVKENLNNFYFF